MPPQACYISAVSVRHWWLVAVVLLVGCKKKTIESIVAEHEPGVRAMIGKVKALAPKVKAMPPMTEPKGSPITDLVLFNGDLGTALLVHERDLLNPDDFAYAPERPRIADEYFGCANSLKAKSTDQFVYPLVPFEKGLEACAAVKYVLVMRTAARRMAAMTGGEHFMGGQVSGDMLFFTLSGEHVGGFPWVAESSESVSVKMGASEYEKQNALDSHMLEKVERAILDGLKRAHPGSAW